MGKYGTPKPDLRGPAAPHRHTVQLTYMRGRAWGSLGRTTLKTGQFMTYRSRGHRRGGGSLSRATPASLCLSRTPTERPCSARETIHPHESGAAGLALFVGMDSPNRAEVDNEVQL